ncbi:MAG TPA: GNAT family N-acetyltransferase [Candidatus Limnocylindrales bacterium]|nr:GNAT family N-acetyltransferase [Candidatus Limnocylindrales bacterium]
MVSRGRLMDVAGHPGFVAEADGDWLGYATYDVAGEALEVTVLESLAPGRGVGSALLAACVGVAAERGVGRVWLVTTNDNLDALRFYQRRGWEMVAFHRDSITEARRTLKPEIPLLGNDGIPIRDELELELPAAQWPAFIARYAWPQS